MVTLHFDVWWSTASCRTAAGNARPHRSPRARYDGAVARLRAGRPPGAGRRPSAEPESGDALSRAGPARAEELDQGHLAEDPKQSRCEVLRHHRPRPPHARRADRTMAAAGWSR